MDKWYQNASNFPAVITVYGEYFVIVQYPSEVNGEPVVCDIRDNHYFLEGSSNWRLATAAELHSLYFKDKGAN